MIELRHRVALGPVDPQVDQGPGLVFGASGPAARTLPAAAFGCRRPQRRHQPGAQLARGPRAGATIGVRQPRVDHAVAERGAALAFGGAAQPHRPLPVWTAVSPLALTSATCRNSKLSSVRAKRAGRPRGDSRRPAAQCGRSQPRIGHALHGDRPDPARTKAQRPVTAISEETTAEPSWPVSAQLRQNRAGHPNLRRGGSEALAEPQRIVDRRVDVARRTRRRRPGRAGSGPRGCSAISAGAPCASPRRRSAPPLREPSLSAW